MDQSGYQIQPADRGTVEDLKKQVNELMERIIKLETLLDIPFTAVIKGSQPPIKVNRIAKKDIEEKVIQAQKLRRNSK